MKLLALTVTLPLFVSGFFLPAPEADRWRQLGVDHATLQHETTWGLDLAWKTFASAFGWAGLDVHENIDDISRSGEGAETVWQYISSCKDFTKLTKMIKMNDEIVKMLDDHSNRLTFFAPDDKSIPRRDEDRRSPRSLHEIAPHHHDALFQLFLHVEALDEDEHKGNDKEREIIKEIVRQVMRYHILMDELKFHKLGFNSSVATSLVAPERSFDREPQRLKVERAFVSHTVTLNTYARVKKSDICVKNGVIHVIDRPLVPPFSVLDEAHVLPQWLSTFTSAIQKVGLEDWIAWHHEQVKDEDKDRKGRGRFVGTPSVTLFAPSNEAWRALPENLVIYLFSPFGRRALLKLLEFHIVPEYLIYSEWIHDARMKRDIVNSQGVELDFEYPFPTALKGSKVDVHIIKTTPKVPLPGVAYFNVMVQGNRVATYDLPARNGVIHTLDQVLDPRPRREREAKGDKGWAAWEQWFPRWVDEN